MRINSKIEHGRKAAHWLARRRAVWLITISVFAVPYYFQDPQFDFWAFLSSKQNSVNKSSESIVVKRKGNISQILHIFRLQKADHVIAAFVFFQNLMKNAISIVN